MTRAIIDVYLLRDLLAGDESDARRGWGGYALPQPPSLKGLLSAGGKSSGSKG